MVLILIEGTNAFAVDNQALERLVRPAVDYVYRLVPDPESFRARVDRWPDAEATCFLLLEQNSVKKERLSRAVLASDCDHANVVISQVHQKVPRLLAHSETYSHQC